MERKFKVGMHVKSLYGYGKVIGFHRQTGLTLVEHNIRRDGLHDGNGNNTEEVDGKQGHCWYIREGYLKPVLLDNPLNRKLYPNRIEESGYLVPEGTQENLVPAKSRATK